MRTTCRHAPWLFLTHPLHLDLGGLRTVIGVGRLLEPRMLKSFLGCDAVSRIVNKNLLEQILEVLQERRVTRHDFL